LRGTGDVQLDWSVDGTAGPPPVVLSTPADRAVKLGDPVTFSFVVTNTAGAQFKWLFNGNELPVTTTTLSIPNMQVTNIGRYKLQIDVAGVQFFAIPTELQINSEGAGNTLAQSKLLDSPS